MLLITSARVAVLAMAALAAAVPAQSNEVQVNDRILVPRIVCSDARHTPCDTMCCTPLQQCAYLELVGWACWEKDISSTYTEPDLNTMLITAHDNSATLTATATEPDLNTIPISAHGNSSITTAPTSHRPTPGSGTAAAATTTRNSAGRVDFRGHELTMLGTAIVGYMCLF